MTEDPRYWRRALLFMPGDSRRKIQKAVELGVDSIVMDLEDGVALSRKEEARRTVLDALQSQDFGRSERLVRINPVGSQFAKDDLLETVEGRPHGYVMPKTEFAEEVQAVSEFLAAVEEEFGWPQRSITLLPIIETAFGVMNVQEIVLSDDRVDALLFGAEDLAADMGAQRTPQGWEVFYGRSAVVTAAKAFGLQAIDQVWFDLEDLDGLEADCRFGRQLGYDGKMVIHPQQVEVAHRAFAPSSEEIRQAQRIVAAYAAHTAAGTGTFTLDGRMVDMPVVRAAEHVLRQAKALGLA